MFCAAYLSDIGGEDGTATTAEPKYSRLHNNFIVANCQLDSLSALRNGSMAERMCCAQMLRTAGATTTTTARPGVSTGNNLHLSELLLLL